MNIGYASVRGKLGFALGAGLLLSVGIGIFSQYQTQKVTEIAKEIRGTWLPRLNKLNGIKRLLTNHSLLAKRRVQTSDFRQLASISVAMRRIMTELDKVQATYQETIDDPAETALFNRFDKARQTYEQSLERAIRKLESGEMSTSRLEFEAVTTVGIESALEFLDRLIEYVDRKTAQAEARAEAAHDRARYLILAAIAVAAIFAFASMLWISTHIVQPLIRVSEAMMRLTAGDEKTGIPHYGERKDEIGVLAEAAQAFQESVVRSRSLALLAELGRRRLDAAISNMPVGLSMFDGNGTLIVCNGIFTEIYGLPSALTVPGTDYAAIRDYRLASGQFEGADPEDLTAEHWACSDPDEPAAATKELRDGRWLSITLQRLEGGGWVAIHEDITARRQAEEQNRKILEKLRLTKEELRLALVAAESSSKAKSSFLANMSHEIRTPLNGILGMAQILDQQDSLSEFQRDSVQTILESGKTLMAILNDVLDLSRIEAGKLTVEQTEGDLRSVFSHLEKLFAPRAGEKGIALNVDIDEAVPESLRFDQVRVSQCAANLISNGIKFTNEGSVTVSVRSRPIEDDEHLISVDVADTGIGISEEAASRLFSEFSQADASTTRKYGGTGLGLAITRKLAKLLGGDVMLATELGRGSTFTLTFLAEAGSGESTAPKVPTERHNGAGRLQGLHVLLVDDNVINRQVARLILAPSGMVITEAADGRQALEQLADSRFDLVLLDVHMPVMDGPETIAHIRKAAGPWRTVPVIALTADAMSGDRERLLAMGMSGYVSKPIDQAALINEIHRVLATSAPGSGEAVRHLSLSA